MSARIGSMRVWVAAIYLMAVLAADGLHFHPASTAWHCGGCAQPSLDFAGSGNGRAGQQLCGMMPPAAVVAVDCPACQFQAQKSISISPPPETGWQPLAQVFCLPSPAHMACWGVFLPPIRAPPQEA